MKKIFFSLILIFSVLFLMPVNVSADTGPKPSAVYNFYNMPKSDYIVVFLSVYERYCSHQSYFECVENGESYYGDLDDLTLVYENNIEYVSNGFHLIDISIRSNNTESIVVTTGYMYPTSGYKILIYDVINDKTYISDEISNYAFNSSYSCDFSKVNNGTFQLYYDKTESVGFDFGAFFIRLIITLAIEIGIAFIFKFNKKSLLIIVITNIITQVLLNVLLNIDFMNQGKNGILWIKYGLIEIGILLVEGLVYTFLCKNKYNKRYLNFVYAAAANIISFLASFIIWMIQF